MVPDAAWNKGWCQCQNCDVGVKMEAFQANTSLKTFENHIYHPTLRTIVSLSHIVNVNSWDSAKWRKPRKHCLELCNSSVMFWECGLDMPERHRHFAIFAADRYSLVGIIWQKQTKIIVMPSQSLTLQVPFAFRSRTVFFTDMETLLSVAPFLEAILEIDGQVEWIEHDVGYPWLETVFRLHDFGGVGGTIILEPWTKDDSREQFPWSRGSNTPMVAPWSRPWGNNWGWLMLIADVFGHPTSWYHSHAKLKVYNYSAFCNVAFVDVNLFWYAFSNDFK